MQYEFVMQRVWSGTVKCCRTSDFLICVTLYFQLLLLLVSSYRYNGDEVNMTVAKSEAKILHEKIKGKHYSDDDVIRIVATRSKAQVNATLNQYKNEFGNDILKVCR